MISEIGLFFLILCLTVTSLGFLLPIFSIFYKKNYLINNYDFQKKITDLTFILIFLSFLCLTYSFLISDFSLKVVSNNSNSQLPLVYKFTGVWGNHEGSILLWLLVMSFFGFLFSKQKINNIDFKKNVLLIQTILCFLVCLFIIFTSNPFEKILPPPIDGVDLNPLLQDPGLVIHPPFLYLGYVGFSIVYSISIATLLLENNNLNFIKILKPWVFLSWIFLTCGIGLGSWWAYYELGWGGFWFWDPVENASLLPWITASALLHTLVVAEKKKIFLNWTLILSIITFSLSLLGTFLVRSGVLVSVHAFANDPSRGIFILILLSLVCGFGIFLFLQKYEKFSYNKKIYLLSREGAISINNIFMLTLGFTILVGTVYPLFSSVFFNLKLSIGAPFFNSILAPVIFPMTVGMILGPYLRWGKDDLGRLSNKLKILLIILFLISLVIWYINYGGPVISIIFFGLGSWIIASSFFEIIDITKQNLKKKLEIISYPPKLIAQSIAHIGVALLIIGATGSSILKTEKIQFQEINEVMNINNFTVKLIEVKRAEGPNYISDMAKFEVVKKGKIVATLQPEKRFYNTGKQVTTEAAIYSTFLGDIYIAIGEKNDTSINEAWTTRIWFNPLTLWIWIGTFLIIIGGSISFFNSLKFKK